MLSADESLERARINRSTSLDKLMAGPKWVFSKSFYAILFCIGILSFVIHEFAHWIAGVALGHDMVASPNHVWPRGAVSAGDLLVICAAGPLVTVAQGIAGVWLVRLGRPMFGFALLYMAFFMRLLATVISLFNPNDEAKVSQLLGVGTWTLPLMVVAGLFILFLSSSRKLELKFRDQLFCFVVASVVISLIVGVDTVFWRNS
jgi:hypothetical protein